MNGKKMQIYKSADVQKYTQKIFRQATIEPVVIERYKTPCFVILNIDKYNEMQEELKTLKSQK